jgi:hypothetical protein
MWEPHKSKYSLAAPSTSAADREPSSIWVYSADLSGCRLRCAWTARRVGCPAAVPAVDSESRGRIGRPGDWWTPREGIGEYRARSDGGSTARQSRPHGQHRSDCRHGVRNHHCGQPDRHLCSASTPAGSDSVISVPPQTNAPHILVVEDDPAVALLLQWALEDQGWSTAIAPAS